ncbi:hypothetical protein [Campylobacter suis]|uniref:Acyl carrier protein n=1 Tax=Campylobacter suis TaxID=2790657 RepID=A0ABM8Q8B1_9BACT|nr:hypothetical protein [Campylobacter suis]CAD7289046.1 hypothetical protein LMG8286_01631 [Campylobacter suis]
MATISIQTTNKSLIEAIRHILSLDPKATMTYEDDISTISKADAMLLQDISDADDKGELEYISLKELKESTNNILRKYGANI